MTVKVLKPGRTPIKRYCELCDVWVAARYYDCPACGARTQPAAKAKE